MTSPNAASRRRRFLLQGGIALVVLAAIAIAIVLVVNANHAPAAVKARTTSTTAGPKNMLSDGILLVGKNGTATAVRTAGVKAKSGPRATDYAKYPHTANIIEFVDYQCPFCREFETTNAANIAKWVAAGKATVEIHPIAFLDSSSEGTRYSSRAENAAACVANYDPDDFLAVTAALYARQPKEATPGLPDSTLVSILSSAGATGPAIAGCVNRETFRSWVSSSTALTISSVFGGNVSTPAILVSGKQYAGSLTDASVFAAFVDKQVPGTTK